MELLLEAGAKTDEPEFARGQTPMFTAAQNGHLAAVRFLAEVHATKDKADNYGATPLAIAPKNGCLEIVRFLVENGATKDLATYNGATPLHVVAHRGHLDIVRFLVENGADQADSIGATYDPMTQSCFFGPFGWVWCCFTDV